MPVSDALKKSARNFCDKYACNFDFDSFEARVDGATFLNPNSGWREAYGTAFEQTYREALENASVGLSARLDPEAMLDDFEYTLIRPYMRENGEEIRHKPYVGMNDRVTRLEYLDRLTKDAPSNAVSLYTEKYKSGELSISQMMKNAELAEKSGDRADLMEIAGYIQALEDTNSSRSGIWKAMHPLKNSAELRDAERMKKMLTDKMGEEGYRKIVAEVLFTFEGYERISAALAQSIALAREETAIKQKMNEAVRETLRIDDLDREPSLERSPRVMQHGVPVAEKQNAK